MDLQRLKGSRNDTLALSNTIFSTQKMKGAFFYYGFYIDYNTFPTEKLILTD